MFGYDAYYFLMNQTPEQAPTIAKYVLSYLPRDILGIRLLQFLTLFASCIIISKIGELFDTKHGWLTGFAALCLAPALTFKHFMFENEFLSYPLIFLAILFIIKSVKEKKHRLINQAVCLALLIISTGFWQGTSYLAVGLIPTISFISIIGVFVLINYGSLFVQNLMPIQHFAERVFLIATIDLYILLIGIFGFSKFKNKKLFVIAWVLLIFALFNSKLDIFVIPFLSIGLIFFAKDFIKGTKFQQPLPYFFALCLITTLTFSLLLYASEPTPKQIQQLENMIETTGTDINICNDWDIGYWLEYLGAKPLANGGEQIQSDCNNHYYITKGIKPDCAKIRNYSDYNFYFC